MIVSALSVYANESFSTVITEGQTVIATETNVNVNVIFPSIMTATFYEKSVRVGFNIEPQNEVISYVMIVCYVLSFVLIIFL